LPSFLYKSDPLRGQVWARVFAERAPHTDFRIWPDVGADHDVEYLAAWLPPPDYIERFPNLKIVFSTGAGVDHYDMSTLPSHIPLVRMIEPGITTQMVEYVTFAVLALHRDMHVYREQQRSELWKLLPVNARVAAAHRRDGRG
jgi:glyoxylate/hydroxypyruvate reductase A